ncbi:MAG: MAPEG family protein [Acidobacteriota bacterium]|nr:MAPEG family protein [Acidobacteriota bacterium]
MRQELIFLPAAILALHTLALVFITGRARVQATKKGEVKLSYFKVFQGDDCPERLLALSRNFSNLFELPVLFYTASVIFFVTNTVDLISLALCWAFVVSRGIHTFIHITYNKVVHRFAAFLVGFAILIFLWLRIVWGIIVGG